MKRFRPHTFLVLFLLALLFGLAVGTLYVVASHVSCSGNVAPGTFGCEMTATDIQTGPPPASVAGSWVGCGGGQFVQGVGITVGNNSVKRMGLRCWQPFSGTPTGGSTCFSNASPTVPCNADVLSSVVNPEDYVLCPAGWLLKGVGFSAGGGNVKWPRGKCFNPTTGATAINYSSRSDVIDGNVSPGEAYAECIGTRKVFTELGFRARSGAVDIGGIHAVCADAPLPAVPTGTISASPNPCTIAAGQTQCSTTITWSASNATNPCVILKETTQLVDCRPNGGPYTKPADYITTTGSTFELHNGNTLSSPLLAPPVFVTGTQSALATGDIRGRTYDKNTGLGISTRVTNGALPQTTFAPGFDYYYLNLIPTTWTISVTVPAGYTSPAERSFCIVSRGLPEPANCHSTTSWTPGNSFTFDLPSNVYIDLDWRFTPTVAPPPPPPPPPPSASPIVTIISPKDNQVMSGFIDAVTGLMRISLAWNYNPNGAGIQEEYLIELLDITSGQCLTGGGSPRFNDVACLNLVNNFRNNGGTGPNGEYRALKGSGAFGILANLAVSRNYAWRVRGVTSVRSVGDWSPAAFFSTGGPPPPSCQPLNFVGGSVSPASVETGGAYTVSCDYGAVTNSINATIGSGNCTFANFQGTAARFNCTAGPTAGIFSNTCSLSKTAPDNYCARTDPIGNLEITNPPLTGSISGRTYDAYDSLKGVSSRVRLVETGDEVTTSGSSIPPYFFDFPNLSAGQYTVRIPTPLPAGYTSVEYSSCVSSGGALPGNCHGPGTWQSNPTYTATVNVPAGEFVSIDWRFVPPLGSALIKRVDKDLNDLSDDFTYAWIDSEVPDGASPAQFDFLVPGSHTAYVTDIPGYDVSAGSCQMPCTVSSFNDPITCDGASCSTPISVSSNEITKVVFRYVPTNSLSGSCSVDPEFTVVGRSVTWSAEASGGTANPTFLWHSSEDAVLDGRTSQTVTRTYSSSGTINASVIITSGPETTPPIGCDNSLGVFSDQGGVSVLRVGSDGTKNTAPPDTKVALDSTSSTCVGACKNPKIFTTTAGDHDVMVSDDAGFSKKAGICTYFAWELECSVGPLNIDLDSSSCDGSDCTIPLSVEAGQIVNVVVQYMGKTGPLECFTANDIDHDPRCNLAKHAVGSSGLACVVHKSGGVHFERDIRVPITPSSRLSSTPTTITITPDSGFTDAITISVDRVEKDDDENFSGDGNEITVPGLRFYFVNRANKTFENSIDVSRTNGTGPYELKFIASILSETETGRYIIYLTANGNSASCSASVTEPILLIVGKDTPGYFEEI